jgi:hypothetical protein
MRRLRFALGIGAVGGALVRLSLVAANVDRIFSYRFVIPSAEAVSIWVTIVSLLALGLLWIAAHDLKAIRTHYRDLASRGHAYARPVGLASALAWVFLMVMIGGLNTLAMVPPQTIF